MGLQNKDSCILGSILGSPHFGQLPYDIVAYVPPYILLPPKMENQMDKNMGNETETRRLCAVQALWVHGNSSSRALVANQSTPPTLYP